ncbi:MAG: DUF2147 domain-containing protein [Pseudomonadota bacterium]
MKSQIKFFAAAFLFSHVVSAGPHDVFGTFLTESGTSHVEIADCGDGTPCGKVSWIDPTSLAEGVTPETLKTPSSGEPVLGLTMLKDFERAKKDWRGGTIYSPEADKTYSSRLKRLEDQTLEVKGCIGFLCQTQIWTPVP